MAAGEVFTYAHRLLPPRRPTAHSISTALNAFHNAHAHYSLLGELGRDYDKNCSNAPPSNELTIAASSCRVNSQPDEEIRLQWSVNTSARTFRECAHLYSNWSSTRASECWAVKDKPRSSIRMEDTDPAQQVVSAQIALATTEPSTYARMIDGVLQNHQHPYTCKFPNFRASTANSCWFSTLRTWSHNARASTVSCSRLSHARSFTTPCNEPSPGI